MPTESAMYAKVRDFVAEHWGAASALTKHDSGPHARGKGISLDFAGVKVEPDVYGLIVRNSVEVPVLGEGKLHMGGHRGTQAFAQALTYRNLGMLSFVFFPEAEFRSAASGAFRAMCAQAGIGLLSVPAGRAPIDPARDVIVELAGGEPGQVVGAIDRTLSEIKGIGQRYLAHVYPTSLRDMLSLFDRDSLTKRELDQRYRRAARGFARVLKQRPYDPMVWRKVKAGGTRTMSEYREKFLAGLLALGLLAPTAEGFRLTGFGAHVRSAIHREELFTTKLGAYVRRLFAIAVMREFSKLVLLALRVLGDEGRPISTRAYCKVKACGETNWRKVWSTDTGTIRCPSCGRRKVEIGLQRRLHAAAGGDDSSVMSYEFRKFARAVGIFEAGRPRDWLEEFPDLPTKLPSGGPIRWTWYWRGPALTGDRDRETALTEE